METSLPPAGPVDYVIENGRLVFTAAYLLRRGKCCGSGCRHCPYRQPQLDEKSQPEGQALRDTGIK